MSEMTKAEKMATLTFKYQKFATAPSFFRIKDDIDVNEKYWSCALSSCRRYLKEKIESSNMTRAFYIKLDELISKKVQPYMPRECDKLKEKKRIRYNSMVSVPEDLSTKTKNEVECELQNNFIYGIKTDNKVVTYKSLNECYAYTDAIKDYYNQDLNYTIVKVAMRDI